jgi:phytoene desaturase
VLSPVPHLGRRKLIGKPAKPYRDSIIKYLEENYMPELIKAYRHRTYIDPLHFQGTLNSYLGSAFSVEPTLDAVGLSAPAQQKRRHSESLFRRRGNASGRGNAGRHFEFGKIVGNMIGKAVDFGF